VGPHFLYFAKGSLYFVGEDLGDNVTKIFSLPRVSNAEMLDQTYDGNVSDPEQYFASAFGVYRGSKPQSVRIAFSETVAPYVKERRWHTSQRVIAKDGGKIEFCLDVDLTPELVQWVMGFGSHARAIEPKELIDLMRDEAQKTLALYVKDRAAS